MDIQNKPTLEQKQAFWAEQLPNFKAKYWLPSHFDFLVFDMEQGNFVVKDDLEPIYEDDANEIFHRVNTGWAMWKRAITFSKSQASEGFILVPRDDLMAVLSNCSDAMENESTSSVFNKTGQPSTWYDHHVIAEKNILSAIPDTQEQTHD